MVVICTSLFLSVCLFLLCREVSTKQGETKAENLGAMFIETSVATGYNIENVSVSTYRE